MMNRDEMLLKSAVQSLQADVPEAEQLAGSARRVAERLGIDAGNESLVSAITSCEDVQHIFGTYRAGTLSSARSLLVEAHLRDCIGCRRQFKSGPGRELDWSAPKPRRVLAWRAQTAAWTLATAATLMLTCLFVYRAYWQIPPGVRAEVQSIDGAAYRISERGDHPLAPGEMLSEGETLRTSGGGHAVLRSRNSWTGSAGGASEKSPSAFKETRERSAFSN